MAQISLDMKRDRFNKATSTALSAKELDIKVKKNVA